PGTELDAVAKVLADGRAHLDHRAVLTAENRDGFLDALGALTRGSAHADVVHGTTRPLGKVVFVFPGQGSQWDGMATHLLTTSPVFADHLT
ncbi:acyltransferase domain-containing protein, partial [Streptomyces regalis]|uniref:acyltransferase domain-containing protein n=1 Tax=Streptomyces regalis TaxID=68262 RepID=UPI00131E13FF